MMNERPNDERVKIWQISPGRWTNEQWREFKKEEIIAIGWELKLGSLLNYDRDSLTEEIRSRYNEGRHSVDSCWSFSREIKKGDIIVAKKGSSREVYGIGVAKTEYEFKRERQNYKHMMSVDWTIAFDERIEVDVEKRFVQWTVEPLTEERYYQVKNSILKRFPELKDRFDALEALSKLQVSESIHKNISNLQESDKISWKEQRDRLRAEERLEFVTFHPSYSYEEFVEGITVNTETVEGISGHISYIKKWGIFKKMCTKALAKALGEHLDSNKETWKDQ